jgi:hypothetical protein
MGIPRTDQGTARLIFSLGHPIRFNSASMPREQKGLSEKESFRISAKSHLLVIATLYGNISNNKYWIEV